MTNEVTEEDGGHGFTRRHGGTETHGESGHSIGRRATHADSRDVRERKYKPRVHSSAACICALVHRGRPPSAANRTAAVLRKLRALRGFVLKLRAPPCP